MPVIFALLVFGLGVYSLVVAIQSRNENRLKVAEEVIVKKKYKLLKNKHLFVVDNFNRWFNAPKPPEIYAHSGIFGRTDKLCTGNFYDYVQSYGLTKVESVEFVEENHRRFQEFHDEVRTDWMTNPDYDRNKTTEDVVEGEN